MILAEKITKLRKQNGWSQEELAMQMNISRQSISKWESAASIPDLDKIIKLSKIFGVSTDYLLKDELEEEERKTGAAVEYAEPADEKLRSVSLEEANSYMELVRQTAGRIAAGVVTCILSPVVLILLLGMADGHLFGISENMATGTGIIVLLLMVAGAVAVFVSNGMKLEKYQYLERENLSLQYGIAGIAESRREAFDPVYKKCITTGVALCIVSVVPLFIAIALDAADMVYLFCVALLFVIIAAGVFLMVWSGMISGSYQKLLEEGEYTREKKLENRKNDNLARVYWCIVVAGYLGYSLTTGNWHSSWVVWPCAGVLYAAVSGVAAMVRK